MLYLVRIRKVYHDAPDDYVIFREHKSGIKSAFNSRPLRFSIIITFFFSASITGITLLMNLTVQGL